MRYRPQLEALEDRLVPAVNNFWIAPQSAIAPGQNAANWDAGTNWSQGHSPNNNENAVFDATHSQIPCYVPTNDNTIPLLPGLAIGNWAGMLTLNSSLTANSISINPRTTNAGNNEVVINTASQLTALQTFTWQGGSITGSGSLQLAGTDNINGTSATDKPTLGALMDVGAWSGNSYTAGALTFAQTSQPLVVKGSGAIGICDQSTLSFLNQPLQGNQTATAISNGDGNVHNLTVDGGTVSYNTNYELYVGMGIRVYSGTLNVLPPTQQQTSGPFHVNGMNSQGNGLYVVGGEVNVTGNLSVDAGAQFSGGAITASNNATLTLGVNNQNSPGSTEDCGATFILNDASLKAYGGFTLSAGVMGTGGGQASISAYFGNFQITGGELDLSNVSGNSALGLVNVLAGNVNVSGGTIVGNVDSNTGNEGVFGVTNTINITGGTFTSRDLNPNPPQGARLWEPISFGVARTGDFATYNLPATWTHQWVGGGGQGGFLRVTENN